MNDFMQQIIEDIGLIQKDYGYIDDNIKRDEYAFNYWILSRLYNIDEEIASSYVTDIQDKGIDCYAHYEDTKELYKIWLHFYVTNDDENKDISDLIENYIFCDPRMAAFVGVKYFKLSDIKSIYYGDRFTNKTSFTAKLTTCVSATSLDVRPKEYGLDWMIDLRFVMVNVADLFLLYRDALKHNYELFEENVREFLGTQGINNGIIKTLQSPTDRENFFYYNNGITIICEKCDTLRGTEAAGGTEGIRKQYGFKLQNPQIVNGCQTINSIYEVLSHCNESKLFEEYKKAFVLAKVYVFDEKTKNEKKGLDKNIVKYTNSQNSIDEKAFASKTNFFLNIQNEFKNRGFLLLVKPSDKYQFNVEYKDKSKFAELKSKSHTYFELFNLDANYIPNYIIPLEKMLKVFIAFSKNGFFAFTKGSSVLKVNSAYYKEFSLNIDQLFTIDNMIRLYLLFNKAEEDKKNSTDNRTPIPYYVLSFIGREFKDLDFTKRNDKLKLLFANKDTLAKIYDFYKNLTPYYTDEYFRDKNTEYNKMIKQEIDEIILDRCITQMIRFAGCDEVKKFIGK